MLHQLCDVPPESPHRKDDDRPELRGSHQRLYPNNTRFNISLIKSDDVLDRAIAKAGLEGQVTAQDMAENITAWASNVNGMQLPSDTTSYKIATTYTITYEKNDEIGPRISARDMLG